MNEDKTKFLGTEKINKLLLKMSTPAIIGMMVSSLYNLVDTIFVGRGIGSLGIAGISIVFPIQMIVMALALTVGIGGASIISRALGSKEINKAEVATGNIFTLAGITGLLSFFVTFFFTDNLLKMFGANAEILPYAHDYTKIIALGTFFFSLALAGSNVIRAEGNAKVAMLIMVSSTIINIVLDPIFIFTFDWGMKGAAWATTISEFFAFAYVFVFFISKKGVTKIHLHNLKLKFNVVKEIFTVGSATLIRQASAGILTIVLNKSLNFYGGSMAIATFGVINRLAMFTMMPVFGVLQGMQPIVGYNYGAKLFDRVRQTVLSSIKATTIMSTLAFLFLVLFANSIISLFSTEKEFVDMTAKTTRIVMLFLPALGFQAVVGGLYQALGKAKPAIILSMMRQIFFLIPLVLILPIFWNLNGIWLAFPLSDSLAIVITYFFYRHEMRLLKNPT
jgi:putative MATE family efflux protein